MYIALVPITNMKVLIALTVAVLAIAQAEDLSKYTPNDLFVIPDKPAPYNPKVVGGDEAAPNSYPHSVAVYIDGRSFCGGSVIAADTVLTAAHCVDSAGSVEIVAGAHNLNNNEDTQQRVTSRNFIVHEDWDRNSLTNDLALVKLSTPLTLNDVVKPINLDNGDCLSAELDDTPGTVSGWGRYGSGSGISPVLREVTNPLLSNQQCRGWFNIITDTHICLSGAGGKSSCNGDSGGALLGNRGGNRAQVGIVSFGSAFGCSIGFPSAYTRVACFNEWVQNNL